MAERLTLIERLEKLTGPDREADCHVAIDLSILPDWYSLDDDETLYVKNESLGPAVAVQRKGRKKSSGNLCIWQTHEVYSPENRLPSYTSSVDAAVALVTRMLPEWSWECRASGTGDKGQATVWNPHKAPGRNDAQRAYNCATPAIALLIALLRALSEGGNKP